MNKSDLTKQPSDHIMATVNAIRYAVSMGATEYFEGKRIAEPYLIELNKRVAQIARKFGKTPYKFTFAGFGLRNFK